MTSSINLSSWYLSALEQYRSGIAALPKPPFKLYPHSLVTGDRFYDLLEIDVKRTIAYQQGKSAYPSPRFVTGALQSDLRRLLWIVSQYWEVKP